MIAPPLTAERLLQSLSARTDFRDAILGDLAEEFAERAESEGFVAARRWYYKEAVRAVPHLLHHWVRSLRVREVRRLVNVVFAAYFLVTTLFAVLSLVAKISLETMGLNAGFLAQPGRTGGVTACVISVLTLTLAGYCAASLDKKTPLSSALFLGVVLSVGAIAAAVFVRRGDTVFDFVVTPVLLLVATTVGGMLQVRNTRFEKREEYLVWRDRHVVS